MNTQQFFGLVCFGTFCMFGLLVVLAFVTWLIFRKKPTNVVGKKPEDGVSEDWKKKIDYYEFPETRPTTEAESRRYYEESQLAREREAQDRKRKIGLLPKCHVCGTGATKPARINDGRGNDDMDGQPIWLSKDDWTKPGDLYKCKKCHKWTCEKCLYHGICRTCANKL